MSYNKQKNKGNKNKVGRYYSKKYNKDIDELFLVYYKNKDEVVLEEIVKVMQSLVKFFADRLFNQVSYKGLYYMVEKDDFISYGNVGLMEAIYRFDPSFNCKFVTFASRRVHGCIIDYIRKNSGNSRYMVDTVKRYDKFIVDYYTKYKKEPTNKEIINELKIKDSTLFLIKAIFRFKNLNLRGCIFENNFDNLNDLIKQSSANYNNDIPEIQKITTQKNCEYLYNYLQQLMRDNLDPTSYFILDQHFFNHKDFTAISRELKIKVARVRRLRTKSLEKLRKVLSQNKEQFFNFAYIPNYLSKN